MKTCEGCGQAKPLDAFYRRRDQPDGRAKTCLECGASKAKADNARRAQRKKDDPAYLERVRSYSREYRRRVRSEVYGVDVEALEAAQDGRCAICRRTADEVACAGRSGERLHVDHDHTTSIARGMLCKKCNSALGLLDDDLDRLMAMAAYLLQSTNVLETSA